MQCRPPTRHTAGPPAAVHPRGRPACPPAALQTTTTDASEQNNTGPLGGPVIIIHTILGIESWPGTANSAGRFAAICQLTKTQTSFGKCKI